MNRTSESKKVIYRTFLRQSVSTSFMNNNVLDFICLVDAAVLMKPSTCGKAFYGVGSGSKTIVASVGFCVIFLTGANKLRPKKTISRIRSRDSNRNNTETQFVICVKNEGHLASLELHKIYQVMPNDKAAAYELVRIIDESSEYYFSPADFHVPIELPAAAEQAFLLAA